MAKELYAWGKNAASQLGDGTTTMRTTPTAIAAGSEWLKLSGGEDHSLGIKLDGTLWAWGSGLNYRLGTGALTDQTTPVQVGLASNWTNLSASLLQSVALRADGSLWRWGNTNSFVGGVSEPTQVGSDSWLAISQSRSHLLAIKSDGTLWGGGDNTVGQLGASRPYIGNNIFALLDASTNWAQISAGSDGASGTSYGIKSDGSLWAWGWNVEGQCGNGTTTSVLVVTRLGTDNDWAHVDAGGYHALAIKTNGSLWAWGANDVGQIGNNATGVSALAPVMIGSSGWSVARASSYDLSLALKTDGTLWSWGSNTDGQLGDGTIVNKAVPLQVGSDTRWTYIESGYRHGLALLDTAPPVTPPFWASFVGAREVL